MNNVIVVAGSCGMLGQNAFIENRDTGHAYNVTVVERNQAGVDTWEVTYEYRVGAGAKFPLGCTELAGSPPGKRSFTVAGEARL